MANRPDKPAARDPNLIVFEVGQTLTSSLVLEDVLATVARQIGEAMDVWSVDIHNHERESETLVYEAYWSRGGMTDEDLAYVGTRVSLKERPDWRRVTEQRLIVETHIDDLDLPVEEREALGKWGYKTTVDAPLIYRDEVFGAIGVSETRYVRRFTADDLQLFAKLCRLAAIAIYHAKMFRAQEERNRRMAALLDASRAITSTVEVEETLDIVAGEALKVVGVTQSSIYEFDRENDALVYRARCIGGDIRRADALGSVYPLADTPVERTILEGAVIVEEHLSQTDLSSGRRASMESFGERTCLHVPLASGQDPVGILRLYDMEKERHFDDAERELLTGLAELAGAAIANARLYRRQHEQSRQLVTLFEASSLIASSFDVNAVIEHLKTEVLRLVGGEGGAVEVRLRDTAGAYVPPEQAVGDAGAEPPAGIAEPDDLAVRAVTDLVTVHEQRGDHWCLAVPFAVRGKAEGYLEACCARRSGFHGDELELIEILANQAAVAVANATLYRKIEQQAVTDGLTGLYNHRYFYERLRKEVARALRYEMPLSVLLLDIDDFKQFNDTHGHPAGDKVLRDIGEILSNGIRHGIDVAARYGGEEFAIILPHTPVASAQRVGGRLKKVVETTLGGVDEPPPPGIGASIVGERLRHSIEETLFPGPEGRRRIHVTVSMGIADLGTASRSGEELVRNADKALYLAKRKGKNRIEVFLRRM
jgi:diguanylate cyclase (GGDEF)-like protein